MMILDGKQAPGTALYTPYFAILEDAAQNWPRPSVGRSQSSQRPRGTGATTGAEEHFRLQTALTSFPISA